MWMPKFIRNFFHRRRERATMTRLQKKAEQEKNEVRFFDCTSCEAVGGGFENEYGTFCLYCDTGK